MKDIPLYHKIFNHYYSLIESKVIKIGDKLPSEKEICEQFYVSRITAKKAINMLSDQGYVERIPGKGSFVIEDSALQIKNKQKTSLIGVILCDIDKSYGSELLLGIEKKAHDLGYSLIFKRSFESIHLEKEIIKDLERFNVDGLIVQPVHGEFYNDDLLKFSLESKPLVFIDRFFEKTSIPYVTSDNYNSAHKMTKKLLEAGYKNIHFISSKPQGTSTLEQRFEGYMYALIDSEEFKGNNVLLTLESPNVREKTNSVIQRDIKRIKQHIVNNPSIDCIFAVEQHVADLTRKAIEELNMNVPEDISLVTFDADDYSGYSYTGLVQRQHEMGENAMQLLHNMISRETKDYVTTIKVDTDLKIGNSTKLLRKDKHNV